MMRKLLILTLSVLAVAGCHKPDNPSGSGGSGGNTNPANPSNPGGSGSGGSGSGGGSTTTPFFNITLPEVIKLYSEAVSDTPLRYEYQRCVGNGV